jgi:hypothetical protein
MQHLEVALKQRPSTVGNVVFIRGERSDLQHWRTGVLPGVTRLASEQPEMPHKLNYCRRKKPDQALLQALS